MPSNRPKPNRLSSPSAGREFAAVLVPSAARAIRVRGEYQHVAWSLAVLVGRVSWFAWSLPFTDRSADSACSAARATQAAVGEGGMQCQERRDGRRKGVYAASLMLPLTRPFFILVDPAPPLLAALRCFSRIHRTFGGRRCTYSTRHIR
jgi:hypothetical protein